MNFELRNQCLVVIRNIVTLYVLTIFFVFPIYNTDLYFNLLYDRYQFFWVTTATFASTCALVAMYYLVVFMKWHSDVYQKGCIWPAKRVLYGLRQTHICLADCFFLLFLIVTFLSTAASEWPAQSISGSFGRFQGAFLWFWYGVAYILVTRFYQPRRWHFIAFVANGMLLAFWGISDYAGFDLFGWFMEIKDSQKGAFSSSFGNINTYTQAMAVYLAIAMGLYVSTKQRAGGKYIVEILFFLLSILLLFIALITGQSDNAVIGIGILLYVLPFAAFKERHGVNRYLFILGCFVLALNLAYVITRIFPNEHAGFDSGVLLRICKHSVFLEFSGYILMVLTYSIYLLRLWKNDLFATYLRKSWAVFGGILIIVVLCILWDANHGGHPEWYERFAKFLYFNDSWGTHRGFCWRIAGEHISDFTFWQRLFGTGPETFGMVTMRDNYEEMLQICGVVFDSTHNEFIQFLFTTGILGCVGYYGAIIAGCIQGAKSQGMGKDASGCRHVAVFAVITYTAVSAVSISVPIVMPFCIIFLGISVGKDFYEIKEM